MCSEESKAVVEEHISECNACKLKLDIQKSGLVFNNDIVSQNLKAKRPFRKIYKIWIMALLCLFIAIPFSKLTIDEVRGEGFGFSALIGWIKTEQFLSALEKGRFEKASKFIRFNGIRHGRSLEKEEEKKRWINEMQKLKDDGIEIVSHKKTSIIADDRFISGDVIISVKHNDKIYDFALLLVANNKVEPCKIDYVFNSRYRKSFKNEEQSSDKDILIKRISEVIQTYSPG